MATIPTTEQKPGVERVRAHAQRLCVLDDLRGGERVQAPHIGYVRLLARSPRRVRPSPPARRQSPARGR